MTLIISEDVFAIKICSVYRPKKKKFCLVRFFCGKSSS
uniref:Uncharacterized protein n=1 Tax=Rhizophora mucronata TaxID=61149 RepID=A0A2P2JUV6_RHIMU